jgi:tetratricopeptide (TPR) repeat protein
MSKCQSAIPFPALLGRQLSVNLPAWAYGAARIGQTIPKRELLQIGRLHRRLGNYVKAQGSLLESLAIEESLEESSRRLACLHELGQIFEIQGEYEAAKSMYMQIIELDEKSFITAHSHYRLGLIDQIKGEYIAARQSYKTGFEILAETSARQKKAQADILFQLGMSFYEQGNFEKAMAHYRESLDLIQQTGRSLESTGRVLQGLAMIYQAQGDKRNAREYYSQAAGCFGELSEVDLAGVNLQIGFMELDQGRIDEARKHFNNAWNVLERLGDRQGIAEISYGLGKMHNDLREYSRASDFFHQALKEYRSLGHKFKIAQSLYELGKLLAEQDTGEAEIHLQQALRIARDIDSKLITADCMFGLGTLCHERGDINDARDYYYPQSLVLYEQMNLRPKIAQVHFQCGQLYHQLGHLQTAEEHYLDVVRVAFEVDEQALAFKAFQQ